MGKGCFCESSSTVFQTELLAVLNCELYKISSGFSWRTLFMVNETAFPFPGNPCSSRRDAAQAGGNAAQEALSLVNQQRTAAGLGALVWNQGLADCATVRAGNCVCVFAYQTQWRGLVYGKQRPDVRGESGDGLQLRLRCRERMDELSQPQGGYHERKLQKLRNLHH